MATVKSLAAAFDQTSHRQGRLLEGVAAGDHVGSCAQGGHAHSAEALTCDLVCFAVPSSQVEMVLKAVQARHRQFQLPPPLFEVNQY